MEKESINAICIIKMIISHFALISHWITTVRNIKNYLDKGYCILIDVNWFNYIKLMLSISINDLNLK